MDIWKVTEFSFLNEEVEEFTSSWGKILVILRSPSYLKEKTFEYCLWGINRLHIQFLFGKWWRVVSLELNIWLSIFTYVSCFDAWWLNVIVNYEQSLKTILAFVAKLGCSSVIFTISSFI